MTVHDIEELQSQNQQLRASLRILSENNEAEEKEETERIKSELRAALVELEEMRQNRGKQTEPVEAIVKQVWIEFIIRLDELRLGCCLLCLHGKDLVCAECHCL